MLKLQGITYKPLAALATLNGLLKVFLPTMTSKVRTGLLNYKTEAEFSDATIANAVKGFYPKGYRVAYSPEELDPTAKLWLERKAYQERDPSGTLIGRSSIIAEHYDIMAVSTQFSEWWHKYCVLYAIASEAQKAQKSGTNSILDENRTTREGDGYIAAFLCATGDLTGSEFAMSLLDEIDVDEVFKKTRELLLPHVDALDHESFKRGVEHVIHAIGVGTNPIDGSRTAYMSAESFEKLFSSPWKQVLKNPHARELMRDTFLSRIPPEIFGDNQDFMLVEGMDGLFVPANLLHDGGTPATFFTELVGIIDGMDPLATDDYARTSHKFVDQFRTKGDLVRGIFVDKTINTLSPSTLAVILSSLGQGSIAGADCVDLAPVVFGTGGQGSVQLLYADRINYFTGMDLFSPTSAETMEGAVNAGLSMETSLPNQMLTLSDPGHASALDWVDFMRWYRRTHSDEVKMLMTKLGRTKKDLKMTKTSISQSAGLVAQLFSDSSRNGVLPALYASFNYDKEGRIGQQGPTLIDLDRNVGPKLLYADNEWGRSESKSVPRVTDFSGNVVDSPISGTYDSRFVGEPQGQNAPSPLILPRIPSTQMLGMNNFETQIALNLLSMPTTPSGNVILDHVRTLDDFGMNTRGQLFNVDNLRWESVNGNLASGVIVNIEETEGFKRGLVIGRTSEGSFNSPTNMLAALIGWARGRTSRSLVAINVSNDVYTPLPLAVQASDFGPYSATVMAGDIDTYDREYTGNIFAAYKYFSVSGGASNENLPRKVWYWDPSRTPAVGPTNRSLYGVVYDDVCFSAAQSQPVEVATGAMHTKDIHGLDPLGYSTAQATFAFVPGGDKNLTTANTGRLRGIGVVEQGIDFAQLDGRVEQEKACYPAQRITAGWLGRIDVISRRWAIDHNAEYGVDVLSNSGYDASVQAGELTGVADLSPSRKGLSHLNPYNTNPMYSDVSSLTLNATDSVPAPLIVFPAGQCSDVMYIDGPNAAPFNRDIHVMMISGPGICKPSYTSAHAMCPMNYLLRTMLGLEMTSAPGPYPLSEYADMTLSPVESSVFIPSVGGNSIPESVIPSLPRLATWGTSSNQPPKLGNIPDTASAVPRWFEVNSSGLPFATPQHLLERRQDRKFGATEIWPRMGTDKYGFERQKYEPSISKNLVRGDLLNRMTAFGKKQIEGYSDELWRMIQTQGV